MLTYRHTEERANLIINGEIKWRKDLRISTIVNCWHTNLYESDAMWRLYLKGNEGVAIQTTTERIKRTIELAKEDIMFCQVQYIDYYNDEWNIDLARKSRYTHYRDYTPIIHKRIEFKHENELRLFIEVNSAYDNETYWENQENRNGHFIKIDLNSLIEKISFAPYMEKKLKDIIISTANNYGYKFSFEDSKMDKNPKY